MYVVLSGAKRNIGDALIVARCEALLRHVRPGTELHRAPSWKPLDRSLIAGAQALVLPGGPGYRHDFYPRIYPLVAELEKLDLPIFAVGLGWKGIPGDTLSLEGYRFSQESRRTLHWIERTGALGCRDYLTMEALRRNGVTRTTMTGCPAWYDLGSLGRSMRRPESIASLVFTPAQLSVFRTQSIAVAKVLAEVFPGALKVCSFHRGLDAASEWFSEEERSNNLRVANAVRELGFEVLDASQGLEQLESYAAFDLHVGYRVHGHIYFLSKRRPSLLLHEDGRGIGASEALGVRGIDAFARTTLGIVKATLQRRAIGHRLPFSAGARLLGGGYRAAPEVPDALRQLLLADLESRFARYEGVAARIDAQFEVMRAFLERLP